MDDEWDRARADSSATEIERLELERLERVKEAMREAKTFARNFAATDKKLLRQIRRLTGYLDAHGMFTNDPEEILAEDLWSPWEDAVNAVEPANNARELLQQIDDTDREIEEEAEELRRQEEEDEEEYEEET